MESKSEVPNTKTSSLVKNTGSKITDEQLQLKIKVLLSELAKAKKENALISVKYKNLNETTNLLMSEFSKMAHHSDKILAEGIESQGIISLHQKFSEEFKISQLLEESMNKERSVSEMMGVYLLGAKKNADEIVTAAKQEAQNLVSHEVEKYQLPVDNLLEEKVALEKIVKDLKSTKIELEKSKKELIDNYEPIRESSTKLKQEAEAYSEKIRSEADKYYQELKAKADENFDITILESKFLEKQEAAKKELEQIKNDANSYASKRTRDADSYVRNIKREAEIYISTTKNDADIYAKIKRDELLIEEKELEKRIEQLKNRFTHQIDQLLDTVDEYS